MNTKKSQHKLFDFTRPTLIVGLGGTGLSCARYLVKRNCPFAFADSRDDLNSLDVIKEEFYEIEILTGEFDLQQFKKYQQIIVSPGISIRSPLFLSLKKLGMLIIGDIELFAQVVDQPVIAITGSNGKSTVTTLAEGIANACGIKTIAGGNLGIPALDLLESQSELYVLELSSFQLETTYSLQTLSATVLNVSEDHMDRYIDLDDYRSVKESIYHNTKNAIINLNEQKTYDNVLENINKNELNCSIISFFDKDPEIENDLKKDNFITFGLGKLDGEFILKKDHQSIINTKDIKLKGVHNYLNILAALALLEPFVLYQQCCDQKTRNKVIQEYTGLPHRCEWVDEIANVTFYNDSKGTNPGATIAAIEGFNASSDSSSENAMILIAGGDAKDADFTELGEVIEQQIKATVLFGVDAGSIQQSALNAGAKNASFYTVDSMQEAVNTASELANAGDIVLFSPACASFDRYKNYMQRGNDFKEKVMGLKEGLKNAS